MSLPERVNSFETDDKDEIADKLLSFYRDNARKAEVFDELRPAIRAYVSTYLRNGARVTEREFFSAPPVLTPKRDKVLASADKQQEQKRLDTHKLALPRRSMLDQMVDIPGYGRYRYGAMTAEQHRARIAYLVDAHIKPTQRTIEGHEWSIREIQKHHVVCLDDLEEIASHAMLAK